LRSARRIRFHHHAGDRRRHRSLNGSALAAAVLILLLKRSSLSPFRRIAPQLRQVLYGLLLVFFTRYRRQA